MAKNGLEWMAECSECSTQIPAGHAHPAYPRDCNGKFVKPTLMRTQLCDSCFASADPLLESLRKASREAGYSECRHGRVEN